MTTESTTFSSGTVVTSDWLNAVDAEVFDKWANVKQHGAVGDGSTDDTAAVHAAIDVAVANNGTVFFPPGVYRVTSGYTNATQGNSITLLGVGVDNYTSTPANAESASILLDSADANSFFYSQTAGSQLTVQNLQFLCNQFVADRKFFKTSASAIKHIFDNVHFVDVERPINFDTNTYFQESRYSNIRFTDSGSFHSVGGTLIGTGLMLDNLAMEGTFPANTEKVLCNLDGIRGIYAFSVILEPATQSTGYTALKLRNTWDANWTRTVLGCFTGFWIEVTGSGIDYTIDQYGGRLSICGFNSNNATAVHQISSYGSVEYEHATFSGSSAGLNTYFTLNDYACQVKLSHCNYRDPGTALTNPQFTIEDCSLSPSGSSVPQTATSHSNTDAMTLWEFDGGYLDPGRVTATGSGGTTILPSTDATYGRALILTPSAGSMDAQFAVPLYSDFPQGGQIFVVAKGVLPTIASGTFEMSFLFNGSNIASGKTWTSANSGAAFQVIFPITAQTANPTTMGIVFTGTAAGTMKLYHFGIYTGKATPNTIVPHFPAKVITYATASPTTGTWAVGDKCINSAPSVGQPKGWICTVAGTSGTWVSEGNL